MRDRERFERLILQPPTPSLGVRIASTLIMLWLVVGVLAAGQRNYLFPGPVDCGGLGTIALTVVAGPLNYMGVNPKVAECEIPQPSQ
ncbi:hypothetical protein [Nocardia bovistercoris]|uniref:Uncharacterized protein n=1 Tax=Nocardia bovistercoris TaxID=2785916 RepID=A0A931ICU7_9NOCA|nr:hypothetical protein [Nocardia bovistercoris]MBH0779069.1 hypothetical protein [Nocardia bovistercoris]